MSEQVLELPDTTMEEVSSLVDALTTYMLVSVPRLEV